MTIARLVAGYGDAAVAVQKVGAQIESISWMTSDGFASAVNSFIAQNHGAGKEDRIHAGYRSALKIVLPWGFSAPYFWYAFFRLRFLRFSSQNPMLSRWGSAT